MDTRFQENLLTVGDHLPGKAEVVPALLHHGRLLHILHAHHRLSPQDRRPISGKVTSYLVSILWVTKKLDMVWYNGMQPYFDFSELHGRILQVAVEVS